MEDNRYLPPWANGDHEPIIPADSLAETYLDLANFVSNSLAVSSSTHHYIHCSLQISGSGVTLSAITPVIQSRGGHRLPPRRYVESSTVENGYRLTNSSFLVDTPTLRDIEGWSRGEKRDFSPSARPTNVYCRPLPPPPHFSPGKRYCRPHPPSTRRRYKTTHRSDGLFRMVP